MASRFCSKLDDKCFAKAERQAAPWDGGGQSQSPWEESFKQRVESRSAERLSKQSTRWERSLRGAAECIRGHTISLRSWLHLSSLLSSTIRHSDHLNSKKHKVIQYTNSIQITGQCLGARSSNRFVTLFFSSPKWNMTAFLLGTYKKSGESMLLSKRELLTEILLGGRV